jgi:hypothetical protein
MRETTPVKPSNAVTVIVEVADEPVPTAAGDVAAMLKAKPKVKIETAVCDRVPFVPVTVTLYVF